MMNKVSHFTRSVFAKHVVLNQSSALLGYSQSHWIASAASDLAKTMLHNMSKVIQRGLLLFLFTTCAQAITPLTWENQQHTPVLFYPTHDVPMVTIQLAFKAGSAYDDKHPGLAALTASMLNQGNDGLLGEQVANKLADAGAIYSANTTRDMIVITLNTLSEPKAFTGATQVLKQILTHPDFPQSAFRQQKDQQLAFLLNDRESPSQMATQTFFDTLYANHPYGHVIYGTEESLKTIQLNDLQHFFDRYLVPKNAVMVIVGDLSVEQAHALADMLLQGRRDGKSAEPIPEMHAASTYTPVTLVFPSSQTALCLGQLGITHQDPNYFPLIVGNYILGGGMLVSRLAIELREKRGLTYGVNSQFIPMPGPGPFLITLTTKANQAKTALALSQEVLARFVQTGPNQQEILAAKQYLVGSFPLALASNTDIANTLLRMAFYRLPLDYLETYTDRINAVTLDQVKRAFQKTIDPNRMLSVSVGNPTP